MNKVQRLKANTLKPMKQNFSFLFPILVLIVYSGCRNSTAKPNIDAVKASPGIFKILLENEHVRVIEYSLKPGEKDNWHTHPPKSSYVVSGGQLTVHLESGDSILADEKPGTASWMDYAGKHYVENTGPSTVTIILTEIK
jgi:quercetin dioxygenase-like cupin family protein